MNPLKHVAIIMDGNGRWGLKHKNSRNAGHKAGLNTVEKIIKESIKNKIDFLEAKNSELKTKVSFLETELNSLKAIVQNLVDKAN